jgi:YD repeat-containing protein
LVSELSYAYNQANQRTVQTENDGTVTTWTYDNAYRLLNEDRFGGPAGTSFNQRPEKGIRRIRPEKSAITPEP